jgi:hypothetical protein
MSKQQLRGAIVGAVVTCLVVVAGAITPAYASSSGHGHLTYLAGGHVASDRHYKPKGLTLSGDSTLFLKNDKWHVWNNTQAVGSSRTGWNDCSPNCAMGTIHWYVAKVTLSKPKYVCGRHFFTLVTFHFTTKRPEGIGQNHTFDATPAC